MGGWISPTKISWISSNKIKVIIGNYGNLLLSALGVPNGQLEGATHRSFCLLIIISSHLPLLTPVKIPYPPTKNPSDGNGEKLWPSPHASCTPRKPTWKTSRITCSTSKSLTFFPVFYPSKNIISGEEGGNPTLINSLSLDSLIWSPTFVTCNFFSPIPTQGW